ncbi:MAG TPA: serine hydrolase [Thermoleophilia bacterium]|nr:serine hydrolase [Thermoleophilia bacterium]
MPEPPDLSRPLDIPKTAAELGLMVGVPPAEGGQVTLSNWQEPPFSRWGFQHVRDLIPTARIGIGGPVREFDRAERDLSGVAFEVAGREVPFEQWLGETATDGLLVLHRGRLVYERYLNGMRPDSRHLLMSVSKSVCSTVIGSLVDEGRLDPQDLVTAHIPELGGSSFDGCTVRDLLDMRAGTKFDEDYDNPDADVRVYEQIYQWRPRTDTDLPGSITDYYATLENDGPHNGAFRYRSILTDLLGWVAERAGGERLAELISTRIWQPMGAEYDADVTVDGYGNAMADGGVCTTLRDLARFGQTMLEGGRGHNGTVVSQAWIDDVLSSPADVVEVFAESEDVHEHPPGAYYRSKWWVMEAARPLYAGLGINGQMVMIDGATQSVIAKFSTWPEPWSAERFALTIAGCRQLLALLDV